ncbi:MAG: kelch repeat-containing protein [Deltaproteobacteria bacterium]|nr:kelch repeat-containing protein [Deltaproteobacteria bacterium]
MRRLLVLAMVGCGDGASTPPVDGSEPDAVSTCGPAAGWTLAPALAQGPAQETATVAVGSRLYVLGGINDSLAVLATVQVFDTSTCAWSMGPALPRPVHHINATTVGMTIWIIGAMETLNFVPVGHVWSWDPSSGATTWTEHAAMPAGTQRGAAVSGAIGTTIYVAGGLRNGAVSDVSALETTTGTWTTGLPSLPGDRDHGCGGVLGGKLYVVGGRAGNINARTGSVEEYTPGGTWVPRAAMPTPRGGTACGVIGDRIIVVGGEGNPATASGVFAEVEAYTPSTNTWEMLTPMISPRHGMGAAVVAGSLYVPGGADKQAFGAVATHDVFTP